MESWGCRLRGEVHSRQLPNMKTPQPEAQQTDWQEQREGGGECACTFLLPSCLSACRQLRQNTLASSTHADVASSAPYLAFFSTGHQPPDRDKLTSPFTLHVCFLQGYCYVNYSTPAAAAAAQADLNGVEYPVGSGFRLKVMYAEIMIGEAGGMRGGGGVSGGWWWSTLWTVALGLSVCMQTA
jgi:hypothetical protein